MTKKEFMLKYKSKLLATITAATLFASSASVSASAANITAQELMDQLIDGKKVTLDSDTLISYIEPIKQAIILNGANLLGEKADKVYKDLLNNKSADRQGDLIDLAEYVGYLLEGKICTTYPQSLQIEQVANYTARELNKMGIKTVDSNKMDDTKITTATIVSMAQQNREIMESSYLVIYNTDIGTYDDECFDINPATGLSTSQYLPLIGLSAATMLATRPKKKTK